MGTLGETLREQREKLGLSLEQAEEVTRIRAKLIVMLENDDYEHLPNPGYVKGYVASYAKFLELDPNEMVDRYRRTVGNLHVHEINVGAEPIVASTGEQHAIPWKTAVAVVAVIAIAAVLIWGIVRIVRPPESQVPAPVPGTVETTSTPAAKPQSKPATKPSAPASGSQSASGSGGATSGKAAGFTLVVTVKPTERSWLRITIDGTTKFEGVLVGAAKEFKVKQEAKVRIGAPASVEITKDGAAVAIPNEQIPTVTIKAD